MFSEHIVISTDQMDLRLGYGILSLKINLKPAFSVIK